MQITFFRLFDFFFLALKQEESFATNHMEDGVHIGKGKIKHLPEVADSLLSLRLPYTLQKCSKILGFTMILE